MSSIIRHPYLIVHAIRHFSLFRLGWSEAFDTDGQTFDNDPWSPRSLAYDSGRDLRWGGR
jgi:hypothetical protein